MRNNFQIGDKVKVNLRLTHLKLPLPLCTSLGTKEGTVCYLSKGNLSRKVGIDFGEGFPGHACYGSISTHTGWIFDAEEVDFADSAIEQPICMGEKVQVSFDAELHATYTCVRTGIVCDLESIGDIIGIDFGKGSSGHTCGGSIPTDTGWYVPRFKIRRVVEVPA